MNPTPHDPIFWLREFRVELSSASNNLYGNGRQQAEIRLTANVQPGQPALTPAQLSSLLLVLEKPDGTYELLPFNGPTTLQWWQSIERDMRFDLMPGSTGVRPLSPPTSTASKLLYVSTTQPGGSNVKLRARIQKDDNTVYYTDEASGFDSHVVLTTVRPPAYGEQDYEWRKTVDQGDVNHVFLHEYSLQLKNLGLSPVYQLIAPGMIRWHRNAPGERYATYVGMAFPGNNTIRYETRIDTGADFEPARVTSTRGSEALILVLNGANNIPYNREGLDHGGPCTVTLVDRHGNDHHVQFRFDEQGTALERRTHIVPSYASLTDPS